MSTHPANNRTGRGGSFWRVTAPMGMAVCVAAGAWAAPERLKSGEETVFAVPRMTTPPRIDGAIDPAEWREALAVSGTVDVQTDLLDPRPATFLLAWDAQHFYMACRVYLRAGYKPRLGGGRVPDGADCYDDGLECLFKPMGANVGSQNHATEFKLNLSCLGYGGTYTRLVVGQIMSNWEPRMKTATRISAPGTAPDGGTWWELETAFSLADFELVGEHRAGDKWLVMLGMNHLPMNPWMQARIPCIGSYFTPQGKSAITLVENTPAVQMTMDSLSNLASDGTAALTLKAYNPAKAPAQVTMDVNVAGKLAKSETLELPAGGEKTFSLNEKLPTGIKEGRFTVRAAQGDTVLLSYTANFQIGRYNSRLQPVPDPDPNAFSFTSRFNPVRGLLEVLGDSYMLPDANAVRALVYEVRNQGTGRIVTAGEITRAVAWNYRGLIQLDKLPVGTYESTARFSLKDGRTYGPRKATFSKQDEAKAFARWWGKDSGDTERVLKPFDPLGKVTFPAAETPTGFSCWGREYAFNALGLPTVVNSQGAAVLAAPARLVVTVGGQETLVPVGTARITDRKDWRVRFSGRAEGAGLAFSATGSLEQDGLVSVDLTYAPKGRKAITVDALRIEYPVINDVAECLVSVGPGNNFAAMTATVLPAGKEGRLWSTFDTGRKGSQMTVGSFYPHVWLGGDRRGFQWWADSDRGWFPDDDVPAHEVVRQKVAAIPGPETCVVLRNNIIGKPVVLSEARTLRFTWIASPFKPLPKGWRMIAATEDGTFSVPHRGTRINPKTGQKYLQGLIANWINPESYDPADWAGLWAEQKAKADPIVRERRPFDLYASRAGVSWQHMSFQLIGWGRKSMEDGVFNYFGDEWQAAGDDTWNPSYIDYATYLLDRAFREGGVVSTYWDLSFPILFRSPLTGLPYELPDGRWQPGYNTLNCRRFFQRLWAVQDRNGLNPGAVGCHSTQSYLFPAMPWVDAVLDGERDWNLDASEMDWIDYYPKERMRAMSEPHTWGVGICWMSNYSSQDRNKVFAAKISQGEYLFMHDSWINPYLEPASHMTRMPTPILDWGLNGEDVVYHPYWRNPYATCADTNILVSLWQLPGLGDGRILIGVYNYDRRTAKDVEVRLDLARLGLGGSPLRASDLYTGATNAPAAAFDARSGILRIGGLAPHRGRFAGICVVDEAAQSLLTRQLPAGLELPGPAIDHGFATTGVTFRAAGTVSGVTCSNTAIRVTLWQRPDRVLLNVHNDHVATAQTASLRLDLDALQLTPRLPWQEFIGIRQIAASDKGPAPALDFYRRVLTLTSVGPSADRLVVIRRY